jgi:hypothetical protein
MDRNKIKKRNKQRKQAVEENTYLDKREMK